MITAASPSIWRNGWLLLLLTWLTSFPALVAESAELEHFRIENRKGEVEEWSWRGKDGPVFGILRKPQGDGPFPAVVISHGAGAGKKERQQFFGEERAEVFASWGMVCIAPYYTHCAFSKGGGQLPAGVRTATEIQGSESGSVVNGNAPAGKESAASEENLRRAMKCAEILKSLPYVDKSRMAAYGNSVGGMVTIKLASAIPGDLKAVAVSAAGVVEKQVKGEPPGCNPLFPGALFPTVEDARKIRSPILIVNGTEDTRVDVRCAKLLDATLTETGLEHETRIYEGEPHGVADKRSDEVYGLIHRWFAKWGVCR